MSEETVAIAILAIGLGLRAQQLKRKAKKKCLWAKEWITWRDEKGAYGALLNGLKVSDMESFKNFMSLSLDDFHLLASKVAPFIQKQDTFIRVSISVEERLAITLHYLATGELNLIIQCIKKKSLLH